MDRLLLRIDGLDEAYREVGEKYNSSAVMEPTICDFHCVRE